MKAIEFETLVAINKLVTCLEEGIDLKTSFLTNENGENYVRYNAKTSQGESKAVVSIKQLDKNKLSIHVRVVKYEQDSYKINALDGFETSNQSEFIAKVDEWSKDVFKIIDLTYQDE